MDSAPALQPTGGSPIDLSKDFEFRLEFDVEEDIEGELEHFVQLARYGLTRTARGYFQQTLSTHLGLFPVLAEYAEFLVSEDAYDELLSILPTSRKGCDFSSAEYDLVRLLTALARARQNAEHEDPFYVAELWWRRQKMDDVRHFDETTIQCIEVCLAIITDSSNKRPPPNLLYEDFPGLSTLNSRLSYMFLRDRVFENIGPEDGYRMTVAFLVGEGRYWEASKIVKLIFKTESPKEAEEIYKVFCEGIDRADTTDENVIVARLSVNNAYLKFRVRHTSALRSWLHWEELRDLQRATARDLEQLLRDFHDDASRHTDEFLDNICEVQVLEEDSLAADRNEPLYRASAQTDRDNQPIPIQSTSTSARPIVETPGHYARSRPSKRDEAKARSLDSELSKGRELWD
ncbi:hypothetical protein PV04_07285 [Phialophora macrospora]|uniref:Uncharacterized protein n=1 Tax=Phialophora macrospora TaxID=1851006 RepID=A0A0D2DS66_9EURO|nr:hypothetical protein PV04_07285 [Phialophora macrospora]